jgi:hypothetical protein
MEWRQIRRRVRVRHRRKAGEPILGVYHEEFRSQDPDEVHTWLRNAYADHNLKISGSSQDFMFSCDLTRLDGMSLGRMRHSMAVDIDVFAGLRNLAIVEHVGGGAAPTGICGMPNLGIRAWLRWPPAGDSPTLAVCRRLPQALRHLP